MDGLLDRVRKQIVKIKHQAKEREMQSQKVDTTEEVMHLDITPEKDYIYFVKFSEDRKLVVCKAKRESRKGSTSNKKNRGKLRKYEHADPRQKEWLAKEMREWVAKFGSIRGFASAYFRVFLNTFPQTMEKSRFDRWVYSLAHKENLSVPRTLTSKPAMIDPAIEKIRLLKIKQQLLEEEINNLS